MQYKSETRTVPEPHSVRRVRTIFLSDLHLGTRGCQAGELLVFLRDYDCDELYLVGDIVDGWALRSSWYWPQSHNDVVQKLLRKVRKGTRLVYLPGNNDEFLRDYVGGSLGGIEIAEQAIHEGADGRRYLVLHGDQFDFVIGHAQWLAMIGDGFYTVALSLNTHLNRLRGGLGLTYGSLSSWGKLKVKKAVNFISRFEEVVGAEAARHGVDGIICGHIHHAVIRNTGRHLYLNTGDWVESCTAIVEHYDGTMELVRWAARQSAQPRSVQTGEQQVAAA